MIEETNPYIMRIGLNALNHLGLNLYSNVPAVISEVVANSWDADAEIVDIDIDLEGGKIVISDDGHGMTSKEINARYLYVGYSRRDHEETAMTPKWKRHVMGRKGIGKLSLFSISRNVEVYTVKNGQKRGFRMLLDKIKEAIERDEGKYYPDPVHEIPADIQKGTRIILTDLKRGLIHTESSLRKRLARRFSIIGEEFHFAVRINGKPIMIEDRDYYHKIQFLWRYGYESEKYRNYCRSDKLESDELRQSEIQEIKFNISGWIGTVKDAGDLWDSDANDNLNKIIILARGKLIHEDILESFNEGGVYSKYLIGEIHAEFLDIDDLDDIATTSRQKVIEGDPRFESLRKFIHKELKHIQSKWSDLRTQQGLQKAIEIPEVKAWYKTLGNDQRKAARSLFGKINQLTIDSEDDKNRLFQYSVLAFENLRYKDKLDTLEKITPENLETFAMVFSDLDDIEATMYYQIVNERIQIIDALREKLDENALERVIQKHLFDHLWLLDPSWERATETPYMEQRVETEFGIIDAKLTKKEREGRLDIKYKTTSGKHVIVELKRADRRLSIYDIGKQLSKYMRALRKVLEEVGKKGEPVESVCIVGKKLFEWDEENGREMADKTLSGDNIRVKMYQELIEDAQKGYKAYLDKKREAGRIVDLIRSIDISGVFAEAESTESVLL